MPRYCFVSAVAPESLDLYRQRHRHVWPEMLQALRDTGWRNYSLFLSPTGQLVGYFESEDADEALAKMAATEVNSRWQAEMAELFLGEGNPDEEFVYLPEIFNLDDQLRTAGLPTRSSESPSAAR